MPIGKISKSGSGFKGLSAYVLAENKEKEKEEKKPEILIKNNVFSDNSKDIAREMREVSNINKKADKPVGHFSISFDPKENISKEKQLEFTKNVIKEMGIDESRHQYLVISHSDKAHFHHHVVFNRVDFEGKLLNDSYTKNKLEVAIDKQEKLMKLDNSLAETRRFNYSEYAEKNYIATGRTREVKNTKDSRKGVEKNKEFISEKIRESLEDKKVSNIQDFEKELAKHKIEINYTQNDNGLLGISFKKDKLSVKGTAVKFKAGQIQRAFNENIKIMEQSKSQNSYYDKIQELKQKSEQAEQKQNQEQKQNITPNSYYDKIQEQKQKSEQEQSQKPRLRR